MYEIVLTIHSIIRWVVLIMVVLATLVSLIGLLRRLEFTERDRKLGVYTTIALDTQLLVGAILYFFLSPLPLSASLEHVITMVLAVISAHLGSALSKRATESRAKFIRAAIFYGLALVLILLGIPWSRGLI